jgi:hypothetical protein
MSRAVNKDFDYISKDYEAFRTDMLNKLTSLMPEYTDHSQTDAGIVLLELLAMGLDVLSFQQDSQANETLLPSAELRSSVMKWCKILSYTPRYSTPSRFKQVFVLSSVQTTDTVIPVGTVVKTYSPTSEDCVLFETQDDLTIPAGKLGNEKDDSGNYLYTVEVVQGQSISNELLGTSSGAPKQRFTLSQSPVIFDSVSIFINEGSGFSEWSRVDSFVDSTSSSKNFTATMDDNDRVTIEFGDGVFGKIPTPYSNGIYAFYRIGGGVVGNVGANKITALDESIALVDSTFNPDLPIEEGFDKESIDSIKLNAPVASRTKWGAITESDFADVVKMNYPQVVFASSQKDSTNAADMNIYVMLKDNATMTQSFKNEVVADLNERKVVGVENINLLAPVFQDVDIVASLLVKDNYSFDTVKGQIEALIQDYLAVGNYDFNTDLSITELETMVSDPSNSIEGIKSFRITSPSSLVVTAAKNVILKLGTLTINDASAS